MTLTLVLSGAALIGSSVAALLSAGYIARGLGNVAKAQPAPDLRTW